MTEKKRWVNRYRRLTGDPSQHGQVVGEFECRCDPATSAHDRMMMGALRNMRDDVYLEDGVPFADRAHA